MSSYALTSRAKADIFEIWSYLALRSDAAADKVEAAIYEACALASEAPLRGHLRPDITGKVVRFWTLNRYRNYALVYGNHEDTFATFLPSVRS